VQIKTEWASITRCLDVLAKIKPETVKLSVDATGQAALSASSPMNGYLQAKLRATAAQPGTVFVNYSRLRGILKGRAQRVSIVTSKNAVEVTADSFLSSGTVP
jgi:hypothetical protein